MKYVALAHDAAAVDGFHVVAVALVCYDRQWHAVDGAVGWWHQHGAGMVFALLVADVAVDLDQVGVLFAASDEAVVEELRALAEAEDAEALGLDLLVANISIKAFVIRMQLEDDETLVDRNGTPLCKRKNFVQNLKKQGIKSVQDFMDVKDWFKYFPLPEHRLVRELFQEIQDIRKVQDEWRARHSTGLHFSNPYVIARVSYT